MATPTECSADGSHFMRLPAELRLMVYQHLLSPSTDDKVYIKTRDRSWKQPLDRADDTPHRRSSYFALDRGLGRCSYKTTYGLDGSRGDGQTVMYPAIMAVNRKIYEETTYHLYTSHSFQFGQYLDAVGPFINDLTSSTQSLVHSLSLRCLLHSPACCAASDSRFWTSMSQRLNNLPKLRRLTITMQGGRPTNDWDGPKELSVSDIRLLYATRHECLDWARELAALDSLEDVEIEADVRPMPRPDRPATLIYAALSASIEGSLVTFLNDELGVPARVMGGTRPKRVPAEGETAFGSVSEGEGGGEVVHVPGEVGV